MARALTLARAFEVLLAQVAQEVVRGSLEHRCGTCHVPPGEWCTPMQLIPHAPRLRLGARSTIKARLYLKEY